MKEQAMKIYLVRGIPGSGKSTTAKSLGGIHLETDQYFTDSETGEYVYNIDEAHTAAVDCFNRFCNAIELVQSSFGVSHANYDPQKIVVANTFTRRWEIQPYITYANSKGIDVVIVESETEWAKDAHGCFEKCIHDVPLDTMQAMLDRWETVDESWNVSEY